MRADITDQDPLGVEMVKVCLAAWPHLPNLVSDYLGPAEWLRESRLHSIPLESLLQRARALAVAAELGRFADEDLGQLLRYQSVARPGAVQRANEANTLQTGTSVWTGFGS